MHPREVDGYFAHGTVTNYWGGSSSATTRLLEEMHYTGLLRIARRERGIRIYAVRENAAVVDAPPPRDRIDALVDVAVRQYAPLPALSLSNLIGRLRYAAPQWRRELKAALDRARRRLAHSQVDRIDWYWPAGERPSTGAPPHTVRLLAPFDPVVWTAANSSCSGDGPIGSRLTHLFRSASLGTARSRCCGVTALLDGPIWR